jgi:hypothetical protein
MGRIVLSVLGTPSGMNNNLFTRPDYGLGAGSSDHGALDGELARMLNQVRTAAGLGTLVLAEAQSATAAKVAPYYFAAQVGTAPETTADKVVLGLEAGWDLDGVVRHGWFTASVIAQSTDPAILLGAALERPGGRQALLEPTARALAIGPVQSQGERVLAGVFATYSFFESVDYSKETAALLDRLTTERAQRHLPAPVRAASLTRAATRAASDVQSGQQAPRDALQQLINESAKASGGTVRGWYFETASLDDLKFPDELIGANVLQLQIAVTHHRAEGQAWGSYVIFVVTAEGGMSV